MLRQRQTDLGEEEESPEEIIDRMTADVENFRGSARRIDDAVMVAIKAI